MKASECNNDTIRALERASIRSFMERNRKYLTGRVLDFGSGTQPYRDLVNGTYVPFEIEDQWPTGEFDAIMSNQVTQYLCDPPETFSALMERLKPRGHFVITGPTNWAEVEPTDLFRFTRAGIRHLLQAAGFEVLVCESRAEIDINGFMLSLGWGAVGRKP